MSATERAKSSVDTDQLAVNTIRTLSMDAVQAANSGHPGMPMAMAPAAYVLYQRIMRQNPANPDWPDRDRFVLSAGHGSMLLYSVLHLAGYDLSLDDLKNFRQWGSLTPGHPERDKVHVTPGVEVTTGPLGQGFANGVGMAIAERFLRDRWGAEVQDHHVFAICSDGDLMEGVASEAASLAGHLSLGRLVYLYDDNSISLDGPAGLSFSENVPARFAAYGWHVQTVEEANDLDALEAAVRAGIAEGERPSLISVKSVIAWPSPNMQNTSKAHGAPLGEDEVRATKEILGWDPDAHFLVPDEVREAFAQAAQRGADEEAAWQGRLEKWREADDARALEWDRAWAGEPMDGLADALPAFNPDETEKMATRSAGGKVMAAFAASVPTMIGGAADLSESTKTEFPGEGDFSSSKPARNIRFGVREHGMGSAVNGMAAHGGIVRPYGSTFLQFADYMRGAIRLSALMDLPVAWVFTHDSVGLGEDGPTHQPVEHFAALRAIPGLTVFRPGDAGETSEAWRVIIQELEGPACLILSRQDLPVLDRSVYGAVDGVARGAYVLAEAEGGKPAAIVAATGSELWVALEARDKLEADGVATRVVSMPSWELFAAQDDDYRESVLPAGVPKVSVEAGISQGWERWVDACVSIERFGASAPGGTVLKKLGITPAAVAERVRDLL
jgi:transketolase